MHVQAAKFRDRGTSAVPQLRRGQRFARLSITHKFFGFLVALLSNESEFDVSSLT